MINQIEHESINVALQSAEQAELDAILPDYLGQHLVQLTHAGYRFELEKSAIRQQTIISNQKVWPSVNTSTICDTFAELPLLAESIDAIMLPHLLDLSSDYKQILREIWRVLAPEGHAIILGYNLSCLWGLPHSIKQSLTQDRQASDLLTITKLRKLLLHLGFQLIHFKTFFFRPPINQQRWLKRLGFIEILGQFLWPYLGCNYLFIVKKPVVTLTPNLNKKRERRIRVKGVMEPSARRGTNQIRKTVEQKAK